MSDFRLKRVYDPVDDEDGTRVLVDRLWPRGVTKENAAVDYWASHIAPSNELRRWFGHRPERWKAFQTRYREELDRPEAQAEIATLRAFTHKGRVTLVFAARDAAMNNAVVLRDFLGKRH